MDTHSSSSSDHRADSPDEEAAPEKLLVAVRVRPLEDGEGSRSVHCVDEKTILLEEAEGDRRDTLRQKRGGERKLVYDMVFGEDSTQEQVYAGTTKGLVRAVLAGYNATVFAYGATGAGKTHTMVGTDREPGIMVRALDDLFHAIDQQGHNFQVSLSYLEVYNETVRDLLSPSSGTLDLRDDSRGRHVTVAGLSEVSAASTQEVMELLQRGNKERTVEPTAANLASSRSHALLSVTVRRSVTPKDRYSRATVRQGRLYMLDLAGSERASHTENRGQRLREGAHINRSLLALGNVISSLSGGAAGGGGGRFVNYRDSKLTRLLREALSGNCRTVMVAHVSPAAKHRDESKNTLTYARRAAAISRSKVQRNEVDVSFHVSQYRNIIQELRGEIARLRNKVADKEEERLPGTGLEPASHLRELIVAAFRDQMKLRRRLMDIDGHLLSLGVQAERQRQAINQWESRNNRLYHRQQETNGNTSESLNEGNTEQAWSELSNIEKEQERYMNLRASTLRELDECRQRASELENDLPSRLDSATERELLSLLCRVHELEADKMALQGERLVETHELRRRGEMIERLNRQQRLTDEIITRQRQLMEEGRVGLPPDLHKLYSLYQQEIHASTLPPVNTENLLDKTLGRGSVHTPTSNSTNSGGEWDGLPPLQLKEPHPTPAPRTPKTVTLPPVRL